ncbi:hypothetical protein ACX9MO_15855 [Pseudooceanicola sp. 502str34]
MIFIIIGNDLPHPVAGMPPVGGESGTAPFHFPRFCLSLCNRMQANMAQL